MNLSTISVHKGQRTVLSDPHRFRTVVAGRRWGKTQTAKTAILTASSLPKQLIWYVAPTYQMARGIMWTELLETIPRKWIARQNETRMSLTLINGTKIELKGADKPDTLRGVGLHFLVMDECQDIKEDTWKKILRPTLATTGGKALFIGTPKAFNWLYELYERGQRGETFRDAKGKLRFNPWKSWQFPTRTSPFVPREEIEAAKADMDEKSFRQEFEASFETMSGRVYYAFERGQHVKPCAFNPKLPIWIGQDFNIDPMSSVILQPQPNGEIWVVDELNLFGSNTEEAADELARRYFRVMKNITFYPDPAGQNRSHARGESDLDILREKGFKRIKHRRKHPKIADRVNAVNRMFKTANGTKRLFVDPKCRHTIEAFEQTIYKPHSREIDKTGGKEHHADALGYVIDIEFPVRDIVIVGKSI